MTAASATESTSSHPALPLFYRDPQLLSSVEHAEWRLKDSDLSFAQDTPAVPIVVGEFTAAMRSYPILFAGDEEITPIALLGLDQRNLSVTDGAWNEALYVPAYVRRYPFGFIAHENKFALAIDTASERLAKEGDEGVPLFDRDKPSEVTLQALRFCETYRNEALATREFCQALKAKALLIERRADATLPDGNQLGLGGFKIVDTPRFQDLDADTVAEWHRKGWLALLHFHLASLDRFSDLLARRSALSPKNDSADPQRVARSN